ncbi:MAG: hypothetical protein PUE97_07330, partial [Subdoligranulum variabile]|nr:hypothetical protein [Subdoligranulum variabile]
LQREGYGFDSLLFVDLAGECVSCIVLQLHNSKKPETEYIKFLITIFILRQSAYLFIAFSAKVRRRLILDNQPIRNDGFPTQCSFLRLK